MICLNEHDSSVCPCCRDKLVSFPHSPLDGLGCPECGSQHTIGEDGSLCEVSSAGLIVLDLVCASCGF